MSGWFPGRRMPEIQTSIDECADGSWEGTLYVGSNFICRVHDDTFLHAADLLAAEIYQTAKYWDRTPGCTPGCTPAENSSSDSAA